MPTGSLPASGKKLWEEVYNKALSGSCKKDKECAARTAWSAVKGAGWYKDSEGKWHKKSLTTEFSLAITKSSHNKQTGEFRWFASGSDTENDDYGDNMTLELFSDFIHRIESNELAPEEFRSEFWKGGMPYLSVSHYPDLDGSGVPGPTDTVYIDGKNLKSNGRFDMDKPIGRAVYDAIRKDLYEDDAPEDKIRISIGFLDWKHKHKATGYVFERASTDDFCSECLKEFLTGESGGKEFMRGQLVHLALTRVPVNKRTEFGLEVDRSMAEEILTRKDDASSIVGEEIAAELDEKAKMIGKSQVLVTKSEEDKQVEAEQPNIEEAQEKVESEVSSSEVTEIPEVDEEESTIEEQVVELSKHEKMEDDEEDDMEEKKKKKHAKLDKAYSEFRANYDEVIESALTREDKLKALQQPLNVFSEALIASVEEEPIDLGQGISADVLRSLFAEAINEAVAPLKEQVGLLQAQLSGFEKTKEVAPTPQRRSLNPLEARSLPKAEPGKPMSIDEIVRKNTLGY